MLATIKGTPGCGAAWAPETLSDVTCRVPHPTKDVYIQYVWSKKVTGQNRKAFPGVRGRLRIPLSYTYLLDS